MLSILKYKFSYLLYKIEFPNKTSFETEEGTWSICPRRDDNIYNNGNEVLIISEAVNKIIDDDKATEITNVLHSVYHLRKKILGTGIAYQNEYFILNLPETVNESFNKWNASSIFRNHKVLISHSIQTQNPDELWHRSSANGLLRPTTFDFDRKYDLSEIREDHHYLLFFPGDLLPKHEILSEIGLEYYKIIEGDPETIKRIWEVND